MSWWNPVDDLNDIWNGAKDTLDGVWDKATDFAHGISGIPSEDDKRNARNAINDQVKAYRDQTEMTRNELNAKRDAEVAVKRQVEEKQIRALRSQYGSRSLLGGNVNSGQNDMNAKLGG